jgi:hypothetical protein
MSGEEVKCMKKTYSQPALVEYGAVEQLTLGSGGTKPDYVYNGSTLVLIDNNCDAQAPATSCLIVGS